MVQLEMNYGIDFGNLVLLRKLLYICVLESEYLSEQIKHNKDFSS